MNKREFVKIIKSITESGSGNMIDEKKGVALSSHIKNDLINHIVRNRQPILKAFIDFESDLQWLASMGYLYEYNNGYFDFLGTSAHKVSNDSIQIKKQLSKWKLSWDDISQEYCDSSGEYINEHLLSFLKEQFETPKRKLQTS